MRIVLTTHAFLPRSLAGVEVYTARLARALRGLGHDVRVLTAVHDLGERQHVVRRTNVDGIEVLEVVNARLGGKLEDSYRVPAVDAALAELFETLRPDCVHAQHLLNLSTGLFDAARRVGAVLALTLHDYWLSCPRDGLRMRADGWLCREVDDRLCAECLAGGPYLAGPLQRGAVLAAHRAGLGRTLHRLHDRAPRLAWTAMRLSRRLWPVPRDGTVDALAARAAHLRERVRQADLVLVPTRFARDRALEWGVPPERLRVAPLGAVEDPPAPRPAGARRRFGYLGTLLPHKGVHVLVAAMRSLPRRDVTLDVFGNPALDPGYARRLMELAAGDERIRFRGPAPEGDHRRIWSSLELMVLPSLWWENSPLSMLEALAAGVPVVASRTGGVPELLPDAAGILVPPGDAGALRDALAAVAEGRLLAQALPPLPLKTAGDGALELSALYSELRLRREAG